MDLNDNQFDIPDIHLSDVLEVIERNEILQQMDPSNGASTSNGRKTINTTPYIKITEQPAPKALRFRYECEGRSAGSIPGANSTSENKTFPTIQIVGYKGRAVVVVSCVTKDTPYRPHPHNLVGRDNCKRGICTIEINNESMTASFQNLGIQCVKRKDIDDALKVREEIRVDPFRTGFSHKDNPTSIDLNAVRLCFQAFLGGAQKGKYSILEPVVSDPIYDKKAMSDLVICKLSDASAPVEGGKDIILLCEKVTKDDIQIRFFEEKDGECNWEGYADFQPSDVHKQVAIYFRTPMYKTTQIDDSVKVFIQLKRPSDGMCSDPRPFMLIPGNSGRVIDTATYPRKKRRILTSESELLRQIQNCPTHMTQPPNFIEGMVIDPQLPVPIPIKKEPDSPNPYYSLPNSHVLVQPSPLYDSRTPSPHYPFPNSNNLYGQASLPQNTVRPLTGVQTNCGSMSGCFTTEINPHNNNTLNNQNTPSQTNYSPPTPSILMDPFPSFDSSDFRELMDNEQVLSANLSASLQLTDDNIPEQSDEETVQENMNMTDSIGRIAISTLNEFLANPN